MTDDELLAALGDVLGRTDPVEPPTERVSDIRRLAEHRREDSPRQVVRRTEPAGVDGRSSRRVFAAVAAAIGLVIGLGLGALAFGRDGGISGTVEYDGAIDGAAATGTLTVTETGIGRVVELRTDQLEILPTGEYYEIWFVGPGDSSATPNRISAGTFHPDADGRSDVVFAAAVNPALYPIVEITAEPGDGDPAPNGPVVLSATID